MPEPEWEYGFYDADDPHQTCYWYVFGILKHDTPESALSTGRKCTSGDTVLVKRLSNETDPKAWVALTAGEYAEAWAAYATT